MGRQYFFFVDAYELDEIGRFFVLSETSSIEKRTYFSWTNHPFEFPDKHIFFNLSSPPLGTPLRKNLPPQLPLYKSYIP